MVFPSGFGEEEREHFLCGLQKGKFGHSMGRKAIPDYQMDLPFLAGDQFFFTIDFQAGYWQQEVAAKDREMTLLQPQMVVCISSKSYLSSYAMHWEHLNVSWSTSSMIYST